MVSQVHRITPFKPWHLSHALSKSQNNVTRSQVDFLNSFHVEWRLAINLTEIDAFEGKIDSKNT